MEELLRRVEGIVERMRSAQACSGPINSDDEHAADELERFLAVKQVLKSHPFSGINRKVQLKPTAWASAPRSSIIPSPTQDDERMSRLEGRQRPQMDRGPGSKGATPGASPFPSRGVSSGGAAESEGSSSSSSTVSVPTEATFILKWGGELTSLGEAQSTLLGAKFRNIMYPGEMAGVLRLHATYRHDLKIYASDEGRVQMTAAAFAKGFLDLEGKLTPILASLVSKHKDITKMLDETSEEGRTAMDAAKAIINSVLTSDLALTSDEEDGGGGGAGGLGGGSRRRLLMMEAVEKIGANAPSPSLAARVLANDEATGKKASQAVAPAAAAAAAGGVAAVPVCSGRGVSNLRAACPEALPPPYSSSSSSRAAPTTTPPPTRPSGEIRPATSYDQLPQSAVSPLIEAITSDERGDCSLLRGAEMSLRQLGNPREALHQLHRLVDALVAELRERVRQQGLDGDTSPALLPTSELPAQPPPPQQQAQVATSSAAAPTSDPPPGLTHFPSVDLSAGEVTTAAADTSPGGIAPYVAAEATTASPAPPHQHVGARPSNGETALLHYGRWAKLKREFYKPKKSAFDTTKIPDLYDNAMYDMLHNQHLRLRSLPALYATARALASYVVPQEYGVQPDDKVSIGVDIAGTMLQKLQRDLLAGIENASHQEERVHQLDHSVLTDVRTPKRHVRTRLYFTSESHIHSLFNVLRWGSSADDGQPSIFSDAAHSMFHQIELGYLTHIVFRVLQRPNTDQSKPSSYRVQVLVSPGIHHHTIVCDAAEHADQWQLGGGGGGGGGGVVAKAEAGEGGAGSSVGADGMAGKSAEGGAGSGGEGGAEGGAGSGSEGSGEGSGEGAQALFDALKPTQAMILASSSDLTLEEVDTFLTHVLEAHEHRKHDESTPQQQGGGKHAARSGSATVSSVSDVDGSKSEPIEAKKRLSRANSSSAAKMEPSLANLQGRRGSV